MKNHHDKPRDMARSALTSTVGVAEQRRRIHKNERARVRAVLHQACDFDLDDLDNLEAVDANGVTGYGPNARRDFDDMIYERRIHDHLGALLRWAHHRYENDPVLRDATDTTIDRYFGSLLPDNLSGFHARDHIKWKTAGLAPPPLTPERTQPRLRRCHPPFPGVPSQAEQLPARCWR